ncbi:energy transducer TonB [Labilibacter sediminis]|nr:energy transducer TonB [Labilibacter sediminis]
MKRIIVLIIAIVSIQSLTAQKTDTLYLESSFEEVNINPAIYYKVLNKIKNEKKKYVLIDYYVQGEIFSRIEYLSKSKSPVTIDNYKKLEKENKFLKHGQSILYYSNGNEKEVRNFLKGKQIGSVVHYDEHPVFFVVENMPEFPGGNEAMRQFIAQTVKYPEEALKQNIFGRVYVSFIIDYNGEVKDAKIIRGVHEIINNEALRVVNAMPKWRPGYQRGKPVNVSYTVPINFATQSTLNK